MERNIDSFKQLESECLSHDKQIYEISQINMSLESDIAVDEVREITARALSAMKEAICVGLESKELSPSKMCGDDCTKVKKYYEQNHSVFGPLFEKILKYALATSEENIRMGKIVACPTAGSCGIIPAALVSVSEEYNYNNDEQLNALITAGEIGRIISIKMPLSGAVAGCQAECGVASAMAAAAVCQLRGGTIEQIINASALVLKNVLGLTCDPVSGLVEVPCVKRNPFLAVYALTAVELSLSGVKSKIPIDEIVDAMAQTGALMSPLLKESSKAGLATTNTALTMKNCF